MPPNIHQPAANSPADWYYSLPPITRVYGTVCVAATLLSVLGLLNPYNLFLSWPLVFGKFQVSANSSLPSGNLASHTFSCMDSPEVPMQCRYGGC